MARNQSGHLNVTRKASAFSWRISSNRTGMLESNQTMAVNTFVIHAENRTIDYKDIY